jgi:hypothetical protein
MVRYRIRVQLIRWYELIVLADSPEEASSKAEALSPRQIIARGKAVRTETGLADPASLELIARRR